MSFVAGDRIAQATPQVLALCFVALLASSGSWNYVDFRGFQTHSPNIAHSLSGSVTWFDEGGCITYLHIDKCLTTVHNECIDSNELIWGCDMATITIRNLDDSIKARLRMRAASHDRSMEEEARVILRQALQDTDDEGGLGTLIHKRFMAAGGVELSPSKRNQPARKPDNMK